MERTQSIMKSISSASASQNPFTRRNLVRSLAGLLIVLSLSLTSLQALPVAASDTGAMPVSTGMMNASPQGHEGMMNASPQGHEGMMNSHGL